MTYKSSHNHLVLTEEEREATGLMPTIPLDYSIHALNTIWGTHIAVKARFDAILSRSTDELSDEDMQQLQPINRQRDILDTVGSVLMEIAAPKIVENFLRSI
jgi:hypothetical protein